jgi:hypothetical protein
MTAVRKESKKIKSFLSKEKRFVDKGNYFLDTETSLLWHKEQKEMTWKEGKIFAKNLKTDGLKWRVPTIKELLTIINYGKSDPATKLPFIMSSFYWSSSTYVTLTDYAWIISCMYGYVYTYYKTNNYYVRCVAGPINNLEDSV